MKRMELIQFNFARLRKRMGWTQPECAEKGEVSNGYIGAIEAGHAKSFGAEAEDKWATIFQVSIAEFFLEPGQIITDAQKLIGLLGNKLSHIEREVPEVRQDAVEVKRHSISQKKKKEKEQRSA